MNPYEILKMIRNGNPKDVLLKMSGNTNPMLTNLVKMAEKGDSKGVETFARNVFKERGKDFDKEFAEFMKNFR